MGRRTATVATGCARIGFTALIAGAARLRRDGRRRAPRRSLLLPLAIPAILLGWWVAVDKPQYRLGYLAFMSWMFYVLSYHEGVEDRACSLLPLMLLSTTVDYWAGHVDPA